MDVRVRPQEEGLATVAHEILSVTDWLEPASAPSNGDAADVDKGDEGDNSDEDDEGNGEEHAVLLDEGTLALLQCRTNALCLLREYERAYELLRRSASNSCHRWAVTDAQVSRYKLTHDLEQLAHLHASNLLDAKAFCAARDAYSEALDAIDPSSIAVEFGELPAQLQRLLTVPQHVPLDIATPWSDRAALRPRSSKSWAALERSYREEQFVVVRTARLAYILTPPAGADVCSCIISTCPLAAPLSCVFDAVRPTLDAQLDDLLTDEALAHLRELTSCATLWHDDKGHYLGAYDFAGFAPSCVARLAQELTAAMPAVIGSDTLSRFWGYKYKSQPQGTRAIGIGAHIDPARSNFNFWVTADDANLEPSSGGMVVWRKRSSVADGAGTRQLYNTFCADEEACNELERALGLDDPSVERTVVPYRCNRCVLFSSDLFHKTDICVFKPEYTSSRINLTMLFGHADALRS